VKAIRLALVALVAWGCATNPATGRRQLILMSEQEEVQVGRQSDAEIREQMGVYSDEALQQYVADIGARLVGGSYRPGLPWTFTVVDQPAINAFALPGGFIYLTRGILPFLQNEAELAGVLGHEIGHVDARHSAEAYSRQLGAGLGLAVAGILAPSTQPFQGLAGAGLGVLFLRYGREAELESDRLGVEYASGAGWDPAGVPGMLRTLDRLEAVNGTRRGIPNWALTHPPAADRVDRVMEAVAIAPASGTATNAAGFEGYLDGMVFGESREQGITRGTEFLHPILRFAVHFPEAWQVTNTSAQVSARPEEADDRLMLLQFAEGTGTPRQVAAATMPEAGWQEQSGETRRINGLEAFVATYTGTVDDAPVTLRAAHVRALDRTYVLAGLATTEAFGSVQATFDQVIVSFRGLSQQEADQVQPSRLDFYTVRPGDTWTAIASGPGEDEIDASTLAVMNGSDPATPPREGARIRIVVGG